ncbi:hypothetical protein F4553_002048 [Allocatelliglobosispora scoriae]|uniref:Uncharacterized protein n=1 Tax=Allocatelliglobosispora scoriae TaxID=643052 RepID=A0A841BNA1_9ACTN|nr:hypothetical protein [Allocatelliglobosispora scoriae]MBB5868669.1 hypothetical protein [Allocatelliglobosispora scoriae]
MTSPRKISIYVPDDVREVLDGVPNASAYIADSIRLRRRHERTRAVLRDAGYLVTDAGVERQRQRLQALDALNSQAVAAGDE